jgi:tetratricopeptide (TPR) repeat protein
MDENQMADARRIYQDMLKKDPASADAAYNLGLIYEKEENWEEALSIWRKLSKGLTANSYYWFESRYRTAKALKQLGKIDEANVIITMTEVLHPEFGDDKLKENFSRLKKEIMNGK